MLFILLLVAAGLSSLFMYSWVRSNLDQHVLSSGFLGNMLRKVFSFSGQMIEPMDGAQTSLHCVMADDIQSGAFYSQFGIYADKEAKAGGWPLKKIPNDNATDENATKLWKVSEKLVEA
jgi:hypothetical protein